MEHSLASCSRLIFGSLFIPCLICHQVVSVLHPTVIRWSRLPFPLGYSADHCSLSVLTSLSWFSIAPWMSLEIQKLYQCKSAAWLPCGGLQGPSLSSLLPFPPSPPPCLTATRAFSVLHYTKFSNAFLGSPLSSFSAGSLGPPLMAQVRVVPHLICLVSYIAPFISFMAFSHNLIILFFFLFLSFTRMQVP